MSDLLWTEQQFTPRGEPGKVVKFREADVTNYYPRETFYTRFKLYEYPKNFKIVAITSWTDDYDADFDPITDEMIGTQHREVKVVCIRPRAEVQDLDTFIEDALRAYRW